MQALHGFWTEDFGNLEAECNEEQFITFWKKHVNADEDPVDLKILYQMHDLDHSGGVSLQEMVSAWGKIYARGDCLSADVHWVGWMYSGTLHDKMKLLFSSFDTDSNGGLDKEEFEKFAALVRFLSCSLDRSFSRVRSRTATARRRKLRSGGNA